MRRHMARAVASGIGALPDDLLQYLMSFLPSRDAVRTCVLARRWRTLWKSVPALRIGDPDSYDGATGYTAFVDDLPRLRDPAAPLQICDISSDCEEDANQDLEWADEAFDRIEPWVQYAISCKVEILRVSFPCCATNMALISSHLKRLELEHMRFDGTSLHLSACQVLEVLELGEGCYIFGDISSQSLRHLNIDNGMFDPFTRLHISAPNLIGLQLIVPGGLTPTLDSMPSLENAYITIGEGWTDSCVCGHDPSCDICSGEVGESNYSHLLEALSSATHLNLGTLHPSVVVFRRDLKRRPVFSNLKTLWLDEWCVSDDFTGLVYFLQHSPALETLTIELYVECLIKEKQKVMETDASYEASELTLQPKHLKAVRIICSTKEDVIIDSILKILCAHGVPSDRIDIEIDIEHFHCK